MPQAIFPTTVVQQRLWLLQQLTPESPVDNIAAPLRLSGPLQVAVLEQSLNAVISRHGALRTTFALVEGQLMQCITPDECVTLSVVALQGLPAEQREAAMQRLVTTEARQPFDLATGPLLRARLLQLAATEHILMLTTHRLICDEESMHLLLQEVAALYTALSTGSPSALPELPMQYSDFALWQRQWLQDDACVEQLSYWRQRLGAQPPFLQLPTDRPRPAIHTYHGAAQSLLLPAAVCEALHALSRQEGVTLFMVLLAAFQTLLQRYSGQEDISVGVPTTGRHCSGTEGLIGCFANTLVLRTDLSGDPTFRELLQRVRAVVLEAHDHRDMPFEKLLEELEPEQDFSHPPLVQAMFQFQQSAQKSLPFPNLHVEHVACDTGTTKCDITLRVMEHTEGLWCVYEYNTALFDAATVARMAGHFQTLLTGIISAPGQTISTLPLLTEAERYQLLVEWNTTPLAPTQGALRHELFAAQAERTPDAIAVVCAGETLTYRELHERATQLAHYLRALGVGPEVLVGLFMERSIALVVSLLGILQAGGAGVPLEPAYPPERLADMLEDAQLPVILTQEHLLPQLPQAPHHVNIVCLERDWQRIARESTAPVVSGVTSGNLTLVFYTSGSTGRPKAVMWPHSRDTGGQARTQATDRLTVADRHLLKSPIGFTLFAREIFWPLLTGAQVFIVPPGREQDSTYLVQLMAEQKITVINVVPSMLRMLLEESGIDACKSLTQVVCFGEVLSAELQERLCTRLSADLSVYYGVTEAPSATSWSRQRGDTHYIVNIGRRLPNKQVFVLDAHLQPVPIGVPGEMYIGGNLARGYFKQPALTAEKFIPNPFSTTPGARMYKTGDLARYLPDGSIEFFGRNDQQVKIRGIRIELGEIEAVLCQHPAVREAVVVVWEQESGASAASGQTDKRLVAYVVPSQEHTPRLDELRRYLKQKLPQYMVPAIFILLEDVPRNPNGKVDRQALPAPDQRRLERQDTDSALVTPRDALDLQLTQIWETVLGMTPIGLQENFFDLGGHSLLAVQLFGYIERLCGKKLPLATLFQAPTIEQLAQVLRQEDWVAPWSSLVAIQPGGSKPPLFCVHAHGGDVLFYRDLATYLGADQPFYALQAQGLDGTRPRHTSIPEMARHYVQEIRTLQLAGPYFLGGFCMGARIAFEMAQQLQAQGQDVALLAMLDAYAPGFRSTLPPRFAQPYEVMLRLQRLWHHLWNLTLLDAHKRRAYIATRAQGMQAQVVQRLRRKLQRVTFLGTLTAQPGHKHRVFAFPRAIHRSYSPQVFAGRITVFRPTWLPLGRAYDPTMGWGDLAADGVEIYAVPGSHNALVFEPRVRGLATLLRSCLAEAHAVVHVETQS